MLIHKRIDPELRFYHIFSGFLVEEQDQKAPFKIDIFAATGVFQRLLLNTDRERM